MFVEETEKNLGFLTHILLQIHRLGDVKIPVVIENQYLVLFANETSSGVMNFKDPLLSSSKSSEHSYRPVTLLRAGAQQIEEFRQTNRRVTKETKLCTFRSVCLNKHL